MDQPLVSIVITCYNRVDRLPETLESVLAQSYAPVEIVIVDDGSTDGTRELVASYGDKVRYHWHENRGIAATRTVGGQLARGEYIAFQDDDDLMPLERIVVLMNALKRYPQAVMATGDWEVIDDQSKIIGQRSRFVISGGEAPVLLKNGRSAVLWPLLTPVPHTTLFRRADGERLAWFDERFFHACEDTDFFARCAALGPIVYVPEVVSLYRKGPGLSATSVLQKYSRFLLFEKHIQETAGQDDALHRHLQNRLLGSLLDLARMKQGNQTFPERVSNSRLRAAVGLLTGKQQLTYRWVTSIRMPVRSLGRRLLGR